jgi:hypothetical protein
MKKEITHMPNPHNIPGGVQILSPEIKMAKEKI